MVLALTAGGLALALRNDPDPTSLQIIDDPTAVDDASGEAPVWCDDAGLHRGDVVEQTPFELIRRVGVEGALALVR